MTYEIELRKSVTFEAAHCLRALPETHKCHRMHGHSYRVEVAITGALHGDPWLIDLGVMAEILRDMIVTPLDHRVLNDVMETQMPTAEALAIWVARKLALTVLHQPPDRRLVEIVVDETATERVVLKCS